jgi:hypothetical protein
MPMPWRAAQPGRRTRRARKPYQPSEAATTANANRCASSRHRITAKMVAVAAVTPSAHR